METIKSAIEQFTELYSNETDEREMSALYHLLSLVAEDAIGFTQERYKGQRYPTVIKLLLKEYQKQFTDNLKGDEVKKAIDDMSKIDPKELQRPYDI